MRKTYSLYLKQEALDKMEELSSGCTTDVITEIFYPSETSNGVILKRYLKENKKEIVNDILEMSRLVDFDLRNFIEESLIVEEDGKTVCPKCGCSFYEDDQCPNCNYRKKTI